MATPICPIHHEHGPMKPGNPRTQEQYWCVEDGGAFWECSHRGCSAVVLETLKGAGDHEP